MKDKNLFMKKPCTLGARNRQISYEGGGILCSYAFLGICEVIFRGRILIFRVEPHISIYFTIIKYFFNLDNLESGNFLSFVANDCCLLNSCQIAPIEGAVPAYLFLILMIN